MSVFTDFAERMRALIFRRRDERELREELDFHVAMDAEQRRQHGLTDAEARRQSMLALGGLERTKEDVRDARGTRMAEDGLGDVAYTLRTLRRSPGFAIVAILTLAVGIGGTTAVYSAVDAVLLQPLPYQQPGQLVRMYQHWDDPTVRSFVTPVHAREFRDRVAAFDGVAAINNYDETGVDIGIGDAARRIRTLTVSSDYLGVLRIRPLIGRGFEPTDENGSGDVTDGGVGMPVVVLSHGLWEQEFHGDPGALGRTLVMSGKSYTVVGVLPAGVRDPVVGAVDAWMPLDNRSGKDAGNANNHYLSVIARLRPGVTIGQAQAEVNTVNLALAKQYSYTHMAARLWPLKDDLVGSSTQSLEIMLGAVALVLVLVCVNIANLLLVRASERAREFALRTALGAERGRIVRQLLTESLTLAGAGAVAGVILARIAIPVIAAMGAVSIPRLATLKVEPRLLLVAVVLATICAVGFGLAPALYSARTQPADALRGQGRGATGGVAHVRSREWLVVAQVALAFVLLVGAGLLIASMQRIHDVDLGVQPDHALVFQLNLPAARYDSTARRQFFELFAQRAEAIPGVIAAGGVSKLPGTGDYNQWDATVVTGPLASNEQKRAVEVQERIISGDYFKAAGIPLVDGRVFNASDIPGAPDAVVVSRSFARQMFPNSRAVGQQLRTGDRTSVVVGVVGDVSVTAEGRGDLYIYHPHTQWSGDRNWGLAQVVRTSGTPASLEPEVHRVLADLDPQLVMWQPMSFADAIGQGVGQRVFTLRLLTAFAMVALSLAALGLFGVLSYGVRLRSREFGIRMALGADAGAVRRMVLRQGLVMTALGTIAGLGGAVALSRVMATVVFHESPLDPRVLAGAVAFMAIVAAVAAYFPARRATGVDPREVLD